jgi:predicted ATPase
MAYPRAKILSLNDGGFTEVKYQETEHYAVTKEFVNDPTRVISQLLSNDSEDVSLQV